MKMGTVDVERYTGPCLITTAVRPKPKPRPGVNSNLDSVTVTDSDKHVSSGHLHHQQQQLPMNDPRNWAGAPLLSMAASIRKTKSGGMNKSWHPPPVYLPAPMHPMECYTPHTSHLQGAPLIRVPRQQPMSFHKKNLSVPVVHGPSVVSRRPPYLNSSMTPTSLAPTHPIATPSPLAIPSVAEMTSLENGDGGSSSGCPSSDTCSVTSDEGLASGGSESSLPRIIKPRKRRKKGGQESQRIKGPTVSESSSTLSELDDLLSNQGDSLAELFRHSLANPSSTTAATSTTDSSTADTTPSCMNPPLWPGQSSGEDDIWSSGCWHSLSPVWSTSGSNGPSPSSASYWPDQRVIRRPDRAIQSSSVTNILESPYIPEQVNDSQLTLHHESGHYLQVSSQLIASPFNGHRDIEIRFFSSTAQANETGPEHNNNNNSQTAVV